MAVLPSRTRGGDRITARRASRGDPGASRGDPGASRGDVGTGGAVRCCAVPRIDENFLRPGSSYLFAEVKRRTQAFREAHPGVRVIDLGIGDITLPLPPDVIAGRSGPLDASGRDPGFVYLSGEGYIRLTAFGSRADTHEAVDRIRTRLRSP
jgi:hypothetical protein